MNGALLAFAIVMILWVICACIAATIAGNKGLSPGGYFLLGLLLGLIGVAIAMVAQPRQAMPPGWYADPWGESPQRWFDGRAWTCHVSPDTTAEAPSV